MRCLYFSYCNEPKYLCCNFCSKKDCDKRCKDDHLTCKLYEQGPVNVEERKLNHIIGKRRNNEMLKELEVKIKQEEQKKLNEEESCLNEVKKKRGRPKKVKQS